jgi:hypothetical protein
MTRDPYHIKRAGVTTVSPRFIYMPPKPGASAKRGASAYGAWPHGPI